MPIVGGGDVAGHVAASGFSGGRVGPPSLGVLLGSMGAHRLSTPPSRVFRASSTEHSASEQCVFNTGHAPYRVE
eukprot:2264535-Prymnesium_polylepis.1